MEDTRLDNLDVDVEKLISFIKKKAQERMAGELVSGLPASTGEHTNEPVRQDVPADDVVPAQIDSVFKLQADFNHQLTRSLALCGNYIQGLQQGLARVEGKLNEETVRSFLKHQMGDLALIGEDLKAKTEGALVRAAETEQRISRELKSVEQLAQVNFGTLHLKLEEEKGQTAHLIQQTSARMQTLSEDLLAVRHEIAAARDHLSISELETHNKLGALEQNLERRLSSFEGQMKQQAEQSTAALSDMEERFTRLSSELSELSQHMDAVNTNAAQLAQKVIHELDELRIRVLRAERVTKHARKTDIVLRDPLAPTGIAIKDQAKPLSYRPNGKALHGVDSSSARMLASQPFDYFLFEHRFRGPVADIRRHHMIYLDLFQGRENVLDLGCGRGEFVELLGEHGVNVTGVDINEDMVDLCRDRGLNVQLGDIFSHLNSLSDNYLDGIFTSQVIEHLSFDQLLALINLCGRKLKGGGIIVAETVNPNCFDALSNFYLDPSHVRPIPAKMLWFLLEQEPFCAKSVIFSSPISLDIDQVLNTNFDGPKEVSLYKDYALVAAKR